MGNAIRSDTYVLPIPARVRRRQDRQTTSIPEKRSSKRVDMSSCEDDMFGEGFDIFDDDDGGLASRCSREEDLMTSEQKMLHQRFFDECPYKDLVNCWFLRWEKKVAAVLHVVRCREFTDWDPKIQFSKPNRIWEYNIAFFDLDEESKIVHGPLFRDIHPSRYYWLDDSINVISIKVAESDVRYPVKIYGTVLARDLNDYRCVYLFNRERDDPQLITRKNRKLALTGPHRALGGTDMIYFEFHLKIKGDGLVDEDFSRGLLECVPYRYTRDVPRTPTLESYLSTVEMVSMIASCTLEASIAVNFLNGKSTFTGKIFAAASGSETTKMVLYDGQAAGTNTELGTGGSVSLSRHIVAVPIGEGLLLFFSVQDSYNKSRRLKFVIRNGVDERTCNLGSYKLQVKIVWKGVFRQRHHVLRVRGDELALW